MGRSRRENLRDVFSIFDENGDGELSTSEICVLLEAFGHSSDAAAKLLREFDTDGDGTLSFSEFQRLMREPIHSTEDTAVHSTAAARKAFISRRMRESKMSSPCKIGVKRLLEFERHRGREPPPTFAEAAAARVRGGTEGQAALAAAAAAVAKEERAARAREAERDVMKKRLDELEAQLLDASCRALVGIVHKGKDHGLHPHVAAAAQVAPEPKDGAHSDDYVGLQAAFEARLAIERARAGALQMELDELRASTPLQLRRSRRRSDEEGGHARSSGSKSPRGSLGGGDGNSSKAARARTRSGGSGRHSPSLSPRLSPRLSSSRPRRTSPTFGPSQNPLPPALFSSMSGSAMKTTVIALELQCNTRLAAAIAHEAAAAAGEAAAGAEAAAHVTLALHHLPRSRRGSGVAPRRRSSTGGTGTPARPRSRRGSATSGTPRRRGSRRGSRTAVEPVDAADAASLGAAAALTPTPPLEQEQEQKEEPAVPPPPPKPVYVHHDLTTAEKAVEAIELAAALAGAVEEIGIMDKRDREEKEAALERKRLERLARSQPHRRRGGSSGGGGGGSSSKRAAQSRTPGFYESLAATR